MIEAVNSVLASSSLLRQGGQQNQTPASNPPPPARGNGSEATVILAPYVDRISMDTNFNTAVLELRDSDTGDVLKQFPTESTLEARQRAETTRARAETTREASSSLRLPNETGSPSGEGDAQTSVSNAPSSLSQSAPQQSLGGSSAITQAAIAALSTGATSGQASTSTVSVFA